jgi:hypothetical protein
LESYLALRRRNGHAVRRDDLRLVAEDFAAAGVNQHLEPVHIIGAVAGVVAEGLNAGKVCQAPSLGVDEGLVDAEVVRVAVDVSLWLVNCV